MGSFSIWHWLVVLVIVVLVFGTKKLANGARDLGSAIHEFKQGMRGTDAPPAALEEHAAPPTAAAPGAPPPDRTPR